MKLLIITQKVDEKDDVLGFFVRWIEEFAKHAEKITVICLEKDEYCAPKNVQVFSLGKEESNGVKILKIIRYIVRFYAYIWRERKNYDAVFVHMNPIYVVLGGVFWKFWHKKIALWYTHKRVDLKLRIAEKLADIIFTASQESFRLKSGKVHVVGHGIDVYKFKSKISNLKSDGVLKILTASRITTIKNIHAMLEAAEILKKDGVSFEMKIAGAPITEADKAYSTRLQKEVQEKNLSDCVFFVGPIPYSSIEKFYQDGDLFLNFSGTGSLDKAVLEAIASGLPVLTSNEAFSDILPDIYRIQNIEPNLIAKRIAEFNHGENGLRIKIEKSLSNHSVQNVIKKILTHLNPAR